MSNLGPLSFFLGIVATRYVNGLFLSQSSFTNEIISHADIATCNPCFTPFDTKSKLSLNVIMSLTPPSIAVMLVHSSISPSPALILPIRLNKSACLCMILVNHIFWILNVSLGIFKVRILMVCFFAFLC